MPSMPMQFVDISIIGTALKPLKLTEKQTKLASTGKPFMLEDGQMVEFAKMRLGLAIEAMLQGLKASWGNPIHMETSGHQP